MLLNVSYKQDEAVWCYYKLPGGLMAFSEGDN